MNQLVHHAYNEAYVKEIDNLPSKISNSQDRTSLFEEFKNRSFTSKAVATKEKQNSSTENSCCSLVKSKYLWFIRSEGDHHRIFY